LATDDLPFLDASTKPIDMSIHVHAMYREGVIYPDQPLSLPENTEVELTVVPVSGRRESQRAASAEARRPAAPRFSAADLAARLNRHAVSVGALPNDFSRADIYRDHD
jgi:predicted DNA-binding antitoxin AbrB/MazE fold protein